MQMARTSKKSNDRTLNRLIVGIAMVLLIGIPLIGVLYFFDQYRDPGPSMADRAITSAEDAVRKNPNSVTTRYALAELYATKSRWQDAMTQYDEILKAAPDNAAVLISRGIAEGELSQPDKAAADFQKVIDAKKGSEMAKVDKQLQSAYYNLAALELKRGNAKKAVDLATSAVAINRTDADALYLLGTALSANGDDKTAVDALRLAISLVPTGWCDPYAALGTAYTSLKDTAGAQYAGGMVAMCQKRIDDARTQLTTASTGTYAVESFIGLGLLAEGEGDNAGAADAYRKALARQPTNFAAVTGLGRVTAADASPSAPAPSVSPAPSASGGN